MLIVVSLHCEADVLSVCGLKLFVSKKISVEDLGDKNSVGLPCQPVQRGAHAAPLPLLFVLVFPTLSEGKKNLPRRGAMGEEHKTESQAAQSQLHHCRKCISRAAPLWLRKRPVDELWIFCTKTAFVYKCDEIWIVSVWRFELLPPHGATDGNVKTLKLLMEILEYILYMRCESGHKSSHLFAVSTTQGWFAHLSYTHNK